MKKIILVLYIALSAQVFSQPERFRQLNFEKLPFQKPIFTQTLVFPGDSLSTIYYLYKVSYQNIVFLKNDGDYNAEIRVDIEITDTNSNFVKREIRDWKIQATSFEQTNSAELFAEGLISLSLSEGKYNINPIITDQNSKREFKIGNDRLDVNKSKRKSELLIVDSKKVKCEDEEFFKLTNFEGNIPFNSDEYNLIIPVPDVSLQEINVTVLSDADTIIKKTLTEFFISSIGFEECASKILVTKGKDQQTNNFILNGVSRKFKEGPFSVIVNEDKEMKFNSFVFWYNKPASLRDPELAIKALKHIEEETVIDSLLDLDAEKLYEGLVDYWKKMDPSPETEYNELMAQYYSRVDYAQINFTSLTGVKGIDTDRGKIFIKFGKPDQVERASNEHGKIVETWIYVKPQRRFVFVDKQGVGEFSLESS
jgi:GWxTD domain-containing protein